MRSPDAVREHERGVVLAITLLVATLVLAVVIGGLLLVGCAVQGASGADGSEAAPPPPERPVRAATTSTSTTTTTPAPFVPGTALCIGDSVMLGASPQYYDTLGVCGTVDASVSRAWASAGSAVQGRALPDRVVLHLGTNGYTRLADWKAASAGHRDWFRDDDIHPSRAGAAAYAGVIAAQL